MSALPVSDYRSNPPAPSGWTERAACRGEDPELFYPPEGTWHCGSWWPSGSA